MHRERLVDIYRVWLHAVDFSNAAGGLSRCLSGGNGVAFVVKSYGAFKRRVWL